MAHPAPVAGAAPARPASPRPADPPGRPGVDPAVPEDDAPRRRLLALLREALDAGRVRRLLLGRYRGAEPGLQRLLVRPLRLRDEEQLSFVYRYATRDVTKNLALEAGLEALDALLVRDFEHAHLLTDTQDIQLAVNRRGHARLQVGRLAAAPGVTPAPATLAHNREKNRFLDLDRPFLADLGVTNAQHELMPAMSRKWKQINKFIEVFSHALDVVAAGAGQAGARGRFRLRQGLPDVRDPRLPAQHARPRGEVTGVELREDMVALCNARGERAWPAGPGVQVR